MNVMMILGLLVGVGAIPLIWFLKSRVSVEIVNESTAVVTRFGVVSRVIEEPGFHWVFDRVLPWVRIVTVSKQLDFREYRGINVNDARGTTIVADLWAEIRIVDAQKALFQVENWENSLQSLLFHAATSILGTREFEDILTHRIELGQMIRKDICDETLRWGVEVTKVYVAKVTLLPEVARQMYQAVSAQLDQEKLWIEENGRIRVAKLQAATEVEVASLNAEAKSQYALAVSKAYQKLGRRAEVLQAYKELHRLSLLHPQRMISFRGFAENDLGAVEAAMLVPHEIEGATGHDAKGRLNALLGQSATVALSSMTSR